MLNTLKKIVSRTKSHGPSDTIKWLRSKLDTSSREKKRGIDTAKFIDGETPIVDDCGGYEPAEYETIDAIFRRVPVSENSILLDYGCGLGRVLFESAMRPFKTVIGVEFDSDISDRCKKNREAFFGSTDGKTAKCGDIKIVQGDAQQYEIPSDVSHIFLWNSFVGKVLENVSVKIQDHIQSSSHRVHMILSLPKGETDSLEVFRFLGRPTKIETQFNTGADIYWFEPDSLETKNPDF